MTLHDYQAAAVPQPRCSECGRFVPRDKRVERWFDRKYGRGKWHHVCRRCMAEHDLADYEFSAVP